MISLRLPEFLEKDLEELARIEGKTKTDIVIDALTFYFYYFLGFKKPKIILLKPEIKEKKTIIELSYHIPKRVRSDAINIFQGAGQIIVTAVMNDRTILYSKTRLPCIAKDQRIVKRKGETLIISIKKELRTRKIGISDG